MKGSGSKSAKKNGAANKSKKISKPAKKTGKKLVVGKPKNSKFLKTVECYANQKDTFEMDDCYKNMGFATRSIHAGNQPNPLHGGVCVPIDLSTTYAQPAPGKLSGCFDYSRCGNPTVLALQRNLASLEGTKYALAFNSGLSATICLFSTLKQGDHLLVIDDVYGGTQRYLRQCFTP